MSDCADSIGQGDLVSKLIRSNNAWQLLPTQVHLDNKINAVTMVIINIVRQYFLVLYLVS